MDVNDDSEGTESDRATRGETEAGIDRGGDDGDSVNGGDGGDGGGGARLFSGHEFSRVPSTSTH